MPRVKFLVTMCAILVASATAAGAEPKAGDHAGLTYWRPLANMNFDKEQEKILEEWNKVALDAKTDKLLDNSRPILLQMHRGAQIEHCDWGLDYQDGINMLLPHLGKARSL